MNICTKYKFSKPTFKIRIKLRTYLFFKDLILSLISNIPKLLSLLLMAVWALVIFMFSHQPADQSSLISGSLNNDLKNVPMLGVIFAYIPIRKCAHFFLYFVLGIFTWSFFKCFCKKPYLLSIGTCYLYACLDEFHQLFVKGRSGTITDTIIDLFGCITALSAINMFKFIKGVIKSDK